jgi:branched-chain amino acid transport system permease protein
MPTFVKRILGLVVVVVLLVGVNAWMGREGLFGFGLPYYYAEIINLTGISVILAVSLNLITGFTGQFSIGHAGFMAVGAYSSVFMTVYYSENAEQWLTGIVGATLAQSLVFLGVIIVGALVAALAGLVVGIPSLRLRGDYLAIVTLGFAEIIRIIILNIDRVGGATGFRGRVPPWDGRLIIPQYANFIWIGGFAVITIVVVYNIVNSDIGRALVSMREDELAT